MFVKPSKRASHVSALNLSLAECAEAMRVCPDAYLGVRVKDLSKPSWYFTLSTNSWLNEFTYSLTFLLAGGLSRMQRKRGVQRCSAIRWYR